MHGIMLKRLGHHVHILEQNLSWVRTDHAAGIEIGPQGTQFFKEHDLYREPYSFSCPGFNFLDKESNIRNQIDTPFDVTSWDVLYYRLRANFNGFQSEYCPTPIEFPAYDGRTRYDIGKRATNALSIDRFALIEFDDLEDGGKGTIHADLVIDADGQNSMMRGKFMPDQDDPPYAGYVIWRGTVPEKDVTEATRKLFDERFNIYEMPRGYIGG